MSVTTWNRLEPIVDGSSVASGLAAPIADPLWLLGRQWQMGELTAEDAGTPVAATVASTAFPIDDLQVGAHVRRFDPQVPLEALVEPEPPAAPDLRQRLRAGGYLVELLEAAGEPGVAAQVASRFAAVAPADAVGAALVRMLGRRAVDAELALDALNGPGRDVLVSLAPEVTSGAAVTAIDRWIEWYLARTGRAAPSAWNPERAAYQFALSASVDGRRVVLDAGDYRGGRLDWSELSARRGAVAPGGTSSGTPGPAAVDRSSSRTEVLLPAPVDLPGGPARRFFEVEDDAIDFNLVAGGPSDVATALLAEVALVYGDDWFVIPVTAPVGSLVRIERIVVADSFGKTTELVARTRSPGWRMFELGGDPDLAAMLVLLPSIGRALDGPAIEEVALGRDETANLAWAIERVTADALGLPSSLDDEAAVAATGAAPDPAVGAATWWYRPLVAPPPAWFPLVRRGATLEGAEVGAGAPIPPPRGHLLTGWPAVRLGATEVPDEGLRLSRCWQLANTADGRRLLWVSRDRRHGNGALASGTLADVLLEPDQ